MKILVGERRAIAAAVLSFYGFIYLLLGFTAPADWSLALSAVAVLYAVAFFGVVAGWFWGRWFAQGIGYWGLASGIIGMWQIGLEPVLIFLAGTHAIIALLLAGEAMASGFDGRPEWRARFHLDDLGVQRLGKSVVRASMSLPLLLMWALAPSQPNQLTGTFAASDLATAALGLIPLGLSIAGLVALVRMRTWGLFALAGAGAIAIAEAGVTPTTMVIAGLSLAAVLPFARPMAQQLRA
jgi:hypothetical protein